VANRRLSTSTGEFNIGDLRVLNVRVAESAVSLNDINDFANVINDGVEGGLPMGANEVYLDLKQGEVVSLHGADIVEDVAPESDEGTWVRDFDYIVRTGVILEGRGALDYVD